MPTPPEATLAYARQQDAGDPLLRFRERFYLLPETIYMDGNSLGLLSRDAEQALLQTLETWKTQGVDGWFAGDQPWLDTASDVGALAAGMMGAAADQVIHSSTVTTNIHALVGSFYQPKGARVRILADAMNFPTDLYALQGQLKLQGRDPGKDLILVPSVDGHTLDEEAILALMTDEVALALLPSVLYRSGQLLDMAYLTAEAHKRGILIGFDCSHSAGVVPHEFDQWEVDFAVWCSYKYLNAGPGGSAFLYVNRRHFDREAMLCGWFGNRRETMFDMATAFDPRTDAGKWQISSPAILGSSTLRGSLAMINEAGIENLRARSLRMTAYLMALADEFLSGPGFDFLIRTPRSASRRGGHVALERAHDAERICATLVARGVVPDFRPPNVIRFCPSPLYGTFVEIWDVVQCLRTIVAEDFQPKT